MSRRLSTLIAPIVLVAVNACGGATEPPANSGNNPGNGNPTATPTALTGVTATAVSATSIRVNFTSRVGDSNYNVERAEGAAGSFGGVVTIAAPSAASGLIFNDVNLKPATVYRYRVVALVGSTAAPASNEVSATTLTPAIAGVADLSADIAASRTLYAETTYTIKGYVHVLNGATLTIRPGTTIRGDYNIPGSSLFIMRGAKIEAVGSAGAPIIFTSSRAAGSRQPGDWGGLVIIGNAPINRSGQVALDGTGTDGISAVSGKNYQVLYSTGTAPSDNSGTLSYVRVEFAGNSPSQDTESGALTFAAVGSLTRISYVQTMGSSDDAFAFFGGGLDGDHLVAYETGDDMFDIADGFSGRLQYLIGLNTVGLTPRSGTTSGDITGIESDGCFGTGCDAGYNQTPYTLPLVANFTLVGCELAANCGGLTGGVGVSLRRGSGGYYINGLVTRFPTAAVSVRDLETYTRSGQVATPDIQTSNLILRNLYLSFPEAAGPVFQVGLFGPVQFSFDMTTNALVRGTAITQSLFTAFPVGTTSPANAAGLDWTPQSTAPIATGGMTALGGRIAAKAGTFVAGTTYRGAADPNGAKWWSGWTTYVRN